MILVQGFSKCKKPPQGVCLAVVDGDKWDRTSDFLNAMEDIGTEAGHVVVDIGKGAYKAFKRTRRILF